MRYFFAFLLLVHGLIHLIGFTKAFKLAAVNQLSQDIARPAGFAWLLATLLFLTAAVLLLMQKEAWWMIALPAVLISQVLIFSSWRDAGYGSLANVLILAAIILAYGSWAFYSRFRQDAETHLLQSNAVAVNLLTETDLVSLPRPVQAYIRFSGALGQDKVSRFKLEFNGKIRQDKDSAWMPFHSVQYNFMEPATRLFFLDASMKKMPVTGYHRFADGQASMDIRLLSLFKVQYQAGPEMDTAETVTFFNDMCCMAPATLIDTRIKWLEAGENWVKAAFTNHGITIHATLKFDERGALINFESEDRYATMKNNVQQQLPWSTPLQSYQLLNGHMLPAYAETIYEYPDGAFCYGTFGLENVVYNFTVL